MSLPSINTILYTSSLGDHTRPAFRQAIAMARQFNAKVVMLHVVEPIGEIGNSLILNYVPKELVEKMHNEGLADIYRKMEQRIADFCQEELAELGGQLEVDIEYRVVEGNREDTILSEAKAHSADLIVMGVANSFGHHSALTRQVVKHSPTPVLAVPVQ